MINDPTLVDDNARWEAWRESSLLCAELDSFGNRLPAPSNPNRVVAAMAVKIDPDTKMNIPVKMKEIIKRETRKSKDRSSARQVEMISSWFAPQPTTSLRRSLEAYNVDWHPKNSRKVPPAKPWEVEQSNFQRRLGKVKGQDLERSIAREKELLAKLSETRLTLRS